MHTNAPAEDRAASFVVCGLGRLGQQCVELLKEFGVRVVGVERASSPCWRIADLPDLLDDLIIGDCSEIEVLKRAGVAQCRAALPTMIEPI